MDHVGFIHGALAVAGGVSGLPWMCAPEIGLFAGGGKRALRFVLGPAEASRMVALATTNGLFHARCSVLTRPVGNTWASLTPSDDDDAPLRMIVLAHDAKTADRVLRAESNGEPDVVGEALGYPRCCVGALAELARAGSLWAAALVERSGPGPFPWAPNRLAAGWGGMCAAGELFPCSLHCPSANAIGLASEVSLRQFGLHRLANTLRKHGLSAVRVQADGAVERASRTGDGLLVEFQE